MFDRFIRLAQAQKALAEGRCEAALQLVADPWIREDRRARDLRSKAVAKLRQQASGRMEIGRAHV